MSARSKARKRALDILFEAEIRDEPVLAMLEERAAQASPPVSAYAAELVRGVQAHRASIDEVLAKNATGWTLERMPAVDRNILRIGAYELLWASGVPEGVAISEAVLLARDLSTDASPAFINGLLAGLHELRPTLNPEAAPMPDAAAEPGAAEPGAAEPGAAAEPGSAETPDAAAAPDAVPGDQAG
jgi:transcription antitermination protein NusB